MSGPLNRLLSGLGVDDYLPPIEAPKPIDVMPVKLDSELWPGGPALPTALEPYTNSKGDRCWRAKGEGERHAKAVEREVLARKLDEIDPDWFNKFLTTDEAARFYRDELAEYEGLSEAPKRRLGYVVHSSPYEPPTVVDALYQDPDEQP